SNHDSISTAYEVSLIDKGPRHLTPDTRDLISMELSQLEVFLAVARERRFSRAAAKLYRTQSAVSQTIRKLEDDLGEALFDRSSREGILTDAGKVLYEYAEKLINLRTEASESLSELRELQKGKLVIAANEFTVLYLLPVLAE